MKKILIIILMSFLAGMAIAQSGNQERQGQEQQQVDKSGQAHNDEPQKQPAADVSDTFTPSEEISEDLAVSFPVDI